MAQKRIFAAHLVFFLAIAIGCKARQENTLQSEMSRSEKLFWLGKVFRDLTARREIPPTSELMKWVGTPEVEVVNHLMQQSEFSYAMADFMMFFLSQTDEESRKLPISHQLDNLASPLRKSPIALSFTAAIFLGQDIFEAFDFGQPYYGSARGSAPFTLTIYNSTGFDEFLARNPRYNELPEDKKIDLVHGYLVEILDSVEKHYPKTIDNPCDPIKLKYEAFTTIRYVLRDYGIFASANKDKISEVFETCNKFGRKDRATSDRMAAFIKSVRDIAVQEFQSSRGRPITPNKALESLIAVYKNRRSVGTSSDAVDYGNFYSKYPTSRINRNRKRAKYILKTFFCDDLTPINLGFSGQSGPASSKAHQHGENPACKACHYKLDPIGGFFREAGNDRSLDDLGQRSAILDSAQEYRYQQYLAYWLEDKVNDHPNIGYIRSPNQPELNDYGLTPRDLFRIIRKSPELKQCLVLRLKEYLLGEDQMIDVAWLEERAQRLVDVEQRNPEQTAKTFKEIVAEFVLSKTYMTPKVSYAQCYDLAAGGDAELCETGFIIKKYCHQCHSEQTAVNGLRLDKTIKANNLLYFEYKDERGNLYSATEVYNRIAASLAAADPEKLMPQNTFMPSKHREILLKWAQAQQAKAKSEAGE